MKGCIKFLLAVIAGLVLGVGGLAGAAWLWAGVNLIAKEATVTTGDWGALREAALTLKLAPAALALKRGQEKELEISLKPEELNHLLDQRVPEQFQKTRLALAAGDTATVIRFSRQLEPHKFVNGEIRADVTGSSGQFEVKVKRVQLGKKELPHSVHYLVSRWIETTLETQVPFKEDRYKLTGFRRDGNNFKVTIHTRPAKTSP